MTGIGELMRLYKVGRSQVCDIFRKVLHSTEGKTLIGFGAVLIGICGLPPSFTR